VVRHGETDWNRQLKVQGVTDVPLNAKGQLQAAASAHALASKFHPHKGIIAIHSSQMCRASETAQAIADALDIEQWRDVAGHEELADGATKTTATTVTKYKDLNEWNLGVLEGLRKEEARARYPDEWNTFSEWANPLVCSEHAETVITEGESMEDVRLRVVTCLEQILIDSDEQMTNPFVVVTHGGVLGQLLRHVLVAQYPLDEQEKIRHDLQTSSNLSNYPRPRNACITHFSINPATKSWEIVTWADISHLAGDAAPLDANYKGGR
jgi:probable phosphoglycerate mutase